MKNLITKNGLAKKLGHSTISNFLKYYKDKYKIKPECKVGKTYLYNIKDLEKLMGISLSEESYIHTNEAIKVLGMSRNQLMYLTKKNALPFYRPKWGSNSGYLYKKSELEIFKKTFAVPNLYFNTFIKISNMVFFMESVIKSKLVTKKIQKRKIDMLRMHFIEGNTLEEIAKEYDLTNERARQLIKLCVHEIGIICDDNNDDMSDVIKRNTVLKIENKRLHKLLSKVEYMFDVISEDAIINRELLKNPSIHIPINNLNISTRAYNLLNRAEAKNIHDILEIGKEGLSKYTSCGKKTIKEIDKILNDLGFKWE